MTRRPPLLALALTACVAAAPAASPTSKPTGGGDLVSIGNDLVRFVAPPAPAWTVHPLKDATADVVVFVNAKADAEIQYILANPDFRITPDMTGQMAVGMCKTLKEKHEADHVEVVMPPTIEHDRRLDIVIHEKFMVGKPPEQETEDEMHLYRSVGPRTLMVTVGSVAHDPAAVTEAFNAAKTSLASAKYNRNAKVPKPKP